MYFYYFVTATDFLNLKALFNRYKLFVTAVQMLQVSLHVLVFSIQTLNPFQFVCMIFQGVYIILHPNSCSFPRRVTLIYVPYIMCAALPPICLPLTASEPRLFPHARCSTLFFLFANFALKTLFKSDKKAVATSKNK
jgi:hypothetical protein